MRPLRVKHIEEPIAAADIDAVAFRVDEKVVSIPADVQAGHERAVLGREHAELRGVAEDGEDLPGVSTERHWEIVAGDRDGPV